MNSFNKSHFVCPFHYLFQVSVRPLFLRRSLRKQAPSQLYFYMNFLI